MATKKTATFEELTKLAADFVTKQKGMWDHSAWTDFVSRVKKEGFDITEEMQSHLGGLLEAMKQFYTAAASTESIENAMKTVVNDSVAFIKRQKGVWGHTEWEEFMGTIQQNTRSLSEGTSAYLGGVLESIKVFYSLSPALPGRQPASAVPTTSSSVARPVSAAMKEVELKPTEAKVEETTPAKASDKRDDLTAIAGIGPALSKKLNAAGIFGYAQLAALSDKEIAHLEKDVIKRAGRIKRDDWVGQAKKLTQA
jgi:predicted flap endonuclease-1-like 5' DNA nuclease